MRSFLTRNESTGTCLRKPCTKNELATELAAAIFRVAKSTKRSIRADLEALGLTVPQGMALHTLAAAGGRLSARELGRECDMLASTATGVVDRLELHGLVERERDNDDRRVVWIKLTEQGAELQSAAAGVPVPRRPGVHRAVRPRAGAAAGRRPPSGGSRRGREPLMPAITEENRKWWTLGAMCFALFMVMLDNTVVNIALPAIRAQFHASISNLSWTVNAYTLVFGVLLVTGGRLGDVFGRKRMFLAGVVVFTLGSIGAGLSQSIDQLIVFRGVQGIGAAFLMPGSLSIITNAFQGPERGRALGLWAGISGLALGMGPVVGGLLVEKAGWEWIFFLNVPVALIAIPVTIYAVQESRDPAAVRRVDFAGILTLTVGLGALVLALVQSNDYGWTSPRILTEFAIAAVGLTAFGLLQWRQSDPMLDLSFFRNRTFNAGNATAFLVTFSMFATFFFLTIYMQTILGLSALETGVRFLPMTILIIVTAPIAGRLSDKYGSRWLLTGGMTMVSLSLFLESRITDSSGYLTLLPAFIVGGIGMGMTMSPMTAAVMGSVDRTKAGAASGVLSMVRMIGGVFGVAALTAVFSHLSAARAAEGHGQSDVFIYALSHSLQYSAVFALAGAVVAFLFVRTHHEEPATAAEERALAPAYEAGD